MGTSKAWDAKRSVLVTGLLFLLGLLAGPALAQSSIDPALNFALSSPGKITLGTNTNVGGSVGALGNLTVGSRAVVTSDAATNGKLKLRNKAKIGGICGSPTLPKIPKSASCNGTDTSPSGPPLDLLNQIPVSGITFCPAAGISGGAFNLKRGNSTLTLQNTDVPQIFDYTSIKLGASAIWTISGPATAVVIISDSGIFKLGRKALINTAGGISASNILILVGGANSTPRVSLTAASVTASLLSTGPCSIGGNSAISGQLYCGGNISLGANATIANTLLISTAPPAVTCPG